MHAAPVRPRVVLDTNVFVSGIISSRGAPRQILDLLHEQAFWLVMSAEQQVELRDVLRRPFLVQRYGIPEDQIGILLDLIDRINVHPSHIPATIDVRDADDRAILGAVLAARADHLVSGDDDLLVLAGHAQIVPLRIVSPRQFLDLFRVSAPDEPSR